MHISLQSMFILSILTLESNISDILDEQDVARTFHSCLYKQGGVVQNVLVGHQDCAATLALGASSVVEVLEGWLKAVFVIVLSR